MKNVLHIVVRQWILLRMAAHEFGFKQPYDIKEEYPIMTSILGFALAPIYMIFVFYMLESTVPWQVTACLLSL